MKHIFQKIGRIKSLMLLGINSHGQYNHYIKVVESYKDNF